MTMTRWRGLIGLTLLAVTMCMMVACGPSSGDAAVEQVLKNGVWLNSDDFKALTPAQQAQVLRLARERHQVVVGNETRY